MDIAVTSASLAELVSPARVDPVARAIRRCSNARRCSKGLSAVGTVAITPHAATAVKQGGTRHTFLLLWKMVYSWRQIVVHGRVAMSTQVVGSVAAPAQPPRLLDQLRALAAARFARGEPGERYVGWVRRFILFHGKRHVTREFSTPAALCAAPRMQRPDHAHLAPSAWRLRISSTSCSVVGT